VLCYPAVAIGLAKGNRKQGNKETRETRKQGKEERKPTTMLLFRAADLRMLYLKISHLVLAARITVKEFNDRSSRI
jgi:hypothetical protein